MLNEYKIASMIEMARIENNNELKRSINVIRSYRSDYLIKHGIFAFIMGSMFFAITFIIYALFHLEKLTENLFTDNFMAFFSSLMVKYGIFMTLFIGINVIIYNFKYNKYYKIFMHYRRLQKKLIMEEKTK